jgi:hypothetical protein
MAETPATVLTVRCSLFSRPRQFLERADWLRRLLRHPPMAMGPGTPHNAFARIGGVPLCQGCELFLNHHFVPAARAIGTR